MTRYGLFFFFYPRKFPHVSFCLVSFPNPKVNHCFLVFICSLNFMEFKRRNMSTVTPGFFHQCVTEILQAVCISASLPLISEWDSIVWMCCTCDIIPFSGHLIVLSLLIIMTEVFLNEHSCIFFWMYFSIFLRSGIDGSKGRYVFNSIIKCQLFSKCWYHFTLIWIMYANSGGSVSSLY